ncbi:MAG: hypothetical protein H7123_08245, partial [Thermoleophilia bacterium]|nr:hypothetical protein [Thermoleophilia bacterium]
WPDVAVGIRKGDYRFRLFGFGGPNHYEMYHNSSPAYDAVRALLLDLAVPSTATDPITGVLQLS